MCSPLRGVQLSHAATVSPVRGGRFTTRVSAASRGDCSGSKVRQPAPPCLVVLLRCFLSSSHVRRRLATRPALALRLRWYSSASWSVRSSLEARSARPLLTTSSPSTSTESTWDRRPRWRTSSSTDTRGVRNGWNRSGAFKRTKSARLPGSRAPISSSQKVARAPLASPLGRPPRSRAVRLSAREDGAASSKAASPAACRRHR